MVHLGGWWKISTFQPPLFVPCPVVPHLQENLHLEHSDGLIRDHRSDWTESFYVWKHHNQLICVSYILASSKLTVRPWQSSGLVQMSFHLKLLIIWVNKLIYQRVHAHSMPHISPYDPHPSRWNVPSRSQKHGQSSIPEATRKKLLGIM